jgi:hypothetical protein
MIYSYNESQRDALFLKIYLIYSTCFGQIPCPSSGVSQHCVRAVGICHAEILKMGKISPTFKISA